MNESILKALMRLFALVAYVNEKGQPSIERSVVFDYLQHQFSRELVDNYLQGFDKYLSEYHPDLSDKSIDERKVKNTLNEQALIKLCNQLNEELEQEQKIFMLVHLLDFIHSGQQVSSYQFQFIEKVAKQLRISEQDYLNTRYFTFGQIEEIKNTNDLLVINTESKPIVKGVKHMFIDNIEGSITVMLLRNTNTLIFRYDGPMDLLLNGHNIKNNRSYIWAQGSVIKNPRFGSVYYTWVIGQFIKGSGENQFVFTADDIEFSYGNSPNGIKKFSLNEESGRLIGIIGGSGSGKSTLLKVLAGVIKPHHGSISINGFDIHKNTEETQGIIGYVPQDEFLIKELTVYENLFYNARLSFKDLSDEKINKLVATALLDFDLVEARDLRVGDSVTTFLSGGQRKRLNIALELLREPSVLFVDEPTSGLSSMDSEKVMNLLKRQTFKGKLVFANIHQPSSEIVKLLDKLLVVDQGGRVIWYGNPVDAISYFKHANHYVDADSSECLSCGNVNIDQILRNVEARVVDVNGRLTRKRKTSPEEWHDVYMERIDPIIRNIKRPHPGTLPENKFKTPSRAKQIGIYLKRDFLSKIKNQQYILITLLEAPILAVLLAFYTRSSRDANGNITEYLFGLNQNIPAFIFMSVIVALFLGMVISAEEIYRDRKLLERERFLNLSRSSYLLSKTFVMFAISAVQMLMFVLISNYVLEIDGMIWRYFLVLFTIACWANMVGMNISSGFKSVVTIYILVPLILVPQLLFSGVVVDFHNLNKSMQSFRHVPIIGDMMTSRWGNEALVITQFKDNKFEKQFYNSEQAMSDALYTKAYWIPEIRDHLNFAHENIDKRKIYNRLSSEFELLRNEFSKLGIHSGEDVSHLIKNLNIEQFSDDANLACKEFLEKTRADYHQKYLRAMREKEKAYTTCLRNLGSKDEFLATKNRYYNENLASLVKNDRELNKYFVYNNHIIKSKDPVFTMPVSTNGRAHFYAPAKRFGNNYIDTFWFNMAVIWLATALLFGVLYFNILYNLIKYFENIKLRRFNRRIIAALNRQYDKKL